ncbi:MAG: type II toxin-antitoxin system prevent-host-death family antitoxin [Anaerolineae bacterium]
MAMQEPCALSEARRVASSEFVRRPGQMMAEVLRDNMVVIQSHGRDVAVLVDIKHFQTLLATLDRPVDRDRLRADPCP